MENSTVSRISDRIMEYGVKPCVIAGCFVLVALLWTFPLQHMIAYPFVFLFFGAVMLLTEVIPQQIWRADIYGRIELCNRHLLDYIGGLANSLRGGSFFRILHPEDAPGFGQAWEAALAGGGRFEAEARVQSGNGVYRWFLIRAIPQFSQ